MLDGSGRFAGRAEFFPVETILGWMDEHGIGSGPISEAQMLEGGTQNLLVRFRRGDLDLVMRRPSAHPRANADRTMQREAAVLEALASSDVPHPTLVASCPDPEVIGAAFYLMEAVDGFCATVTMPDLHSDRRDIRHDMGLSLVEGAARLGRIDYREVGLADFGKPDDFLERQTDRWCAQLESYARHEKWPGPGELAVDEVRDWLDRNLPASSYRPGILHGDYHIGNVLYRFDGPQLAAIVDWELATIGDPLLDLGWVLATWPDPDGEMPAPGLEIVPNTGLASHDELINHYAQLSDRDLSVIPWYAVLACYKLGIILEGTHARAFSGKADKETGNLLHLSAVGLFERARRWIYAY